MYDELSTVRHCAPFVGDNLLSSFTLTSAGPTTLPLAPSDRRQNIAAPQCQRYFSPQHSTALKI
ncbi:hypothetical protein BDZ97DRAFT_1855372 [Flammula alnicola]|nr:hypothetical protein BDZ97DRAFT_1855372 [Flammula alnicola]